MKHLKVHLSPRIFTRERDFNHPLAGRDLYLRLKLKHPNTDGQLDTYEKAELLKLQNPCWLNTRN